MAGNILQKSITPVKPKVLEKERIFVYVEEASSKVKGIASFDSNNFLVNAGHVVLNTKYLSEAPFDRASLIKLDKDDFKLSEDVTQINWSYAHDKSGSARTNGFGLVKIADNSAGYLRFTDDDNHYLEVDTTKLDKNIDNKITLHNTSEKAHNDIRAAINLKQNINDDGLNTDNKTVVGAINEVKTAVDEKLTGLDTVKIDILNIQNSLNNKVNKTSSLGLFNIDINDGGITLAEFITGSTPAHITVKSRDFELFGQNRVFNGGNIATLEDINTKISELNAVQIRNKEPNLIIEATVDTVQEIATQYITDNYNREPQTNDGLFITMTDKNNDVIEYAYFNSSWINIGLNDIDLSNYVDKTSLQTISGDKDFTGQLTKNGENVATETYVYNYINSLNATEVSY